MHHLQDDRSFCAFCGKEVISDNDCPCLQRREPEDVVLVVGWIVFVLVSCAGVVMLARLVF